MSDSLQLERVMYVDDDPDLRNIVRVGLELGGGFTVKLCATGQQALDEVTEFQPDMILLDVVMPDMSGPQLLEQLKKKPDINHIPVVFLTSKILPEQLTQYEALGAIGVIRKPFNPMKLSEQVTQVWHGFLDQQ